MGTTVGKAKKAPVTQDITPGTATRPPTLLETLQYAISEKDKTDNAIALSQALGRVVSRLVLTVGLVVAPIAVALVLVGKLPPGFAIAGGLVGTGAVTVGGRMAYRSWKARRSDKAAPSPDGVLGGTMNRAMPLVPDSNAQPPALPSGTQPIDDVPRRPADVPLADPRDESV